MHARWYSAHANGQGWGEGEMYFVGACRYRCACRCLALADVPLTRRTLFPVVCLVPCRASSFASWWPSSTRRGVGPRPWRGHPASPRYPPYAHAVRAYGVLLDIVQYTDLSTRTPRSPRTQAVSPKHILLAARCSPPCCLHARPIPSSAPTRTLTSSQPHKRCSHHYSCP